MYDTRTVRNSIRYLYRGAVHEHGYAPETVNALLREVDCKALSAVFRKTARSVYAFETRGRQPLPLLYRGRDLFGQRAALLDADSPDGLWCNGLSCHELWMQERGTLVTTRCVAVRTRLDCGAVMLSDYRSIGKYPWQSELCLNLELLTARLRAMCVPVRLGLVPVYDA